VRCLTYAHFVVFVGTRGTKRKIDVGFAFSYAQDARGPHVDDTSAPQQTLQWLRIVHSPHHARGVFGCSYGSNHHAFKVDWRKRNRGWKQQSHPVPEDNANCLPKRCVAVVVVVAVAATVAVAVAVEPKKTMKPYAKAKAKKKEKGVASAVDVGVASAVDVETCHRRSVAGFRRP